MKRIFTILLMLAVYNLPAQTFNNEWIKFNQTYYKFKVGAAGLYRISKATLDAANIGGTQVQFFELWRNGEKVPFYTSVATGTLPVGGYVEFWGEPNDGKPDKPMYFNPLYQHVDKISLETDTAVYFLSINTDQSGKRYTDLTNNVAGSSLTPEPYFMYTAGHYFKERQNLGFAVDLTEYVYSAAYDRGEYWSSVELRPATPYTTSLSGLSVYTGGPNATLKFGVSGNALNARTVKVSVNSTLVSETVMDYFSDLNTSVSVPLGLITSGTASVTIANGSVVATDRIVSSYYELVYPREFKFGNDNKFNFTLPAKAAGYLLKISEFNYGSTAPVLYDITSGQRLVGDITTTPGSVQFALPGSSVSRDFVLVNVESASISNIGGLTAKTFVNYSSAANQGNYIIITHPLLYAGSTGNNPINDYKTYRQSADGGGFSVTVADIDDLVDQFAFGIRKHPLSVRNFLRFARASFSMNVKYAFLIGRGMTYNEYRNHLGEADIDKLNIVPTFGTPASDNLLSSATVTNPVPVTPIGRLSVVHGSEIEDYLQKVKEYEGVQKNSPNTLAGREWMKNIIQVTGSSEAYLGGVLCNYMTIYKQIIEDTAFGGFTTTFCKSSIGAGEELASDRIEHLFEQGISFLNYFGHSSSTTLEFNLDNPQAYNNAGKYPIFFVNGCNAGNFFTYYPGRLVANETLSEKFVLAKQKGSIAFVASTHYGIVNYLNLYLTNLYRLIGQKDINNSLGETFRDVFQSMLSSTGTNDFYTRIHAEEITLHGDPSLKLNTSPKPDYVVEAASIKINPAFISVAEPNYEINVRMVNIGKAVGDSIDIIVTEQYPDKSTSIIYQKRDKGIKYADSVKLVIPMVATRDIGLHKITVTLDQRSEVDEVSESNNVAVKEFYVFQDEARPVYPYNYAIVNEQVQKLFASTADPFSTSKGYVVEIDTTEEFNSNLKVTKKITSGGGLLEFEPGMTYLDSTVYYWRTSPDVSTGMQWSTSSFYYVANGQLGYSQSHYYQHLKSELTHMTYAQDRSLVFNSTKHNIFSQNSVYPTGSDQIGSYFVSLDGLTSLGAGCAYNEIIFNVIHPVKFKAMQNTTAGLYGSKALCAGGARIYNFMFDYTTAANRKKAMDFMDNYIADGYYVIVRLNVSPMRPGDAANVYADKWKADTTIYGSGNSLYHKLFYAGLYELDSFYRPRTVTFMYKKNDLTFNPRYQFTKDENDRLSTSDDIYTPDTVGTIKSPKFGPALEWKEVQWQGTSKENPKTDKPTVTIIGVDHNNVETELYKLDDNTHNFDVSAIDVDLYPYLMLKMRNIDSINLTPYQLKYWNITYKPVPEGGLAPGVYLYAKDTIQRGETMKFAIAFKNISKTPFDSIVIKATLQDNANVVHELDMHKYKPIISGDTILINIEIDSKTYAGTNTLFVNVNPDYEQPEQYTFNNFLYKTIYVNADDKNPLLDVTFDGMHILNRDIVSAKPHIQIKLKDESTYLLLNDTAQVTVQVKYPNNAVREYKVDNDTLRFTPATSGTDNAAILDFTPAFIDQINPEGDDYELIVKGKDRSGNKTGTSDYRVGFRVINKAMISNLLNYPNPFSTSTAFVFTVTGSEVPQNIKIQILTVTGKIVREITIDELGPIRIGRNITDYKWDGRDQYGQKLGNGVYLYRVVTNLNGKTMEKYKAKGDNTDQYFTNGYGKMYLMR